jgi:aminoglycoside phosphotransferase (APT) family kinase protein
VIAEEDNSSILGAPFFLMRRVEGRVPPDRPCWHEGGWTAELSIAERTRLYENGLAALVALHSVRPGNEFGFLARGDKADAFDAYLDHVAEWYAWSRSALVSGPDTIAAALEYVRAERPTDVGDVCVTWGDARVGNIIFDDSLEVAAVLDWEGAALGPAGIDLGWWLMFEQFFCEAAGVPRLAGIANRAGTIECYEALGGRAIENLRYYEILAALVFGLINNRLAHLAMTEYGAPRDRATGFVDRNITLLRGWLDSVD